MELGKVKNKVNSKNFRKLHFLKVFEIQTNPFLFYKNKILFYFTINIYLGRDLANETVTDIQMFQRFLNAILLLIP